MCADYQFEPRKHNWLSLVNGACALTGGWSVAFGLAKLYPTVLFLGMFCVVAGTLGAVVASD